MHTRETSGKQLRVAILVAAGQTHERWELELFRRLIDTPDLSLDAFLIETDPPPSKGTSPFEAIKALDDRLFCPRQVDHGTAGEAIRSIPRVPLSDGSLANRHFDIVISHRPGPPPESIWQVCDRFWSYDFMEHGAAAASAFGFHECLEARPVTRIDLVRLLRDGTRYVIGTCVTNTKFSFSFNAQYAKSMLPALVRKKLMLQLAPGYPLAEREATPARESTPAARFPGPRDFVRYAVKVLARAGQRAANTVLRRIGAEPEQWTLVTCSGDVLESSLDAITELKQPKGERRADPFLFEKDGKTFVFFESFRQGGPRGHVCVGTLNGDRIEDIVPLDFGQIHNSYPYVFEHGGEIFMIPETSQRNRVEVWRCERFPDKWTLHATALEGESPADTVLFEWERQHWLFTNLSSGTFHDHCAELHAYRVDGPDLKVVEPHPLNPVVLDTTSARNGGRPFVRDGRLIRPAQITSHGRYGYGLKFLEITTLSMEDYREREVRRIEPRIDQSTIGCHHFDSIRDFFILDARRAYGSKVMGARPIAVRPS